MKCTQICPSGALELVGKDMTVSEVMDEVIRDMLFYEISGGGVTFSGGEPTAQVLFLEALLKKAKDLDLNTCIETNGYAGNEVWKKLIPYLDHVLFDIKHMDSVIHENMVGAATDVIAKSLQELARQVDVILRTPLIPEFNDSEDFVGHLGQFAASIPKIKECHLLLYHEYGSSKYTMLGKKANFYNRQTFSDDKLKRYKEILENQGLTVKVH